MQKQLKKEEREMSKKRTGEEKGERRDAYLITLKEIHQIRIRTLA